MILIPHSSSMFFNVSFLPSSGSWLLSLLFSVMKWETGLDIFSTLTVRKNNRRKEMIFCQSFFSSNTSLTSLITVISVTQLDSLFISLSLVPSCFCRQYYFKHFSLTENKVFLLWIKTLEGKTTYFCKPLSSSCKVSPKNSYVVWLNHYSESFIENAMILILHPLSINYFSPESHPIFSVDHIRHHDFFSANQNLTRFGCIQVLCQLQPWLWLWSPKR